MRPTAQYGQCSARFVGVINSKAWSGKDRDLTALQSMCWWICASRCPVQVTESNLIYSHTSYMYNIYRCWLLFYDYVHLLFHISDFYKDFGPAEVITSNRGLVQAKHNTWVCYHVSVLHQPSIPLTIRPRHWFDLQALVYEMPRSMDMSFIFQSPVIACTIPNIKRAVREKMRPWNAVCSTSYKPPKMIKMGCNLSPDHGCTRPT